MKHLSDEELIELYYGEAPRAATAHRATCRECSARHAQLKQTLDLMGPSDVELPAQHGELVWGRLRTRLIPYGSKTSPWRGWAERRAVALGVTGAMLLAMAILGGRYWERHVARSDTVTLSTDPQAAQRALLLVLADHLDRTERLLVALEHADLSDQLEDAQLRSEARALLAPNLLYRTTASSTGDPILAGVLDRLDGVLAEIANEPDLTAEDLRRLRQQMNTQGILLEIRVLMARLPDQGTLHSHARGRSI